VRLLSASRSLRIREEKRLALLFSAGVPEVVEVRLVSRGPHMAASVEGHAASPQKGENPRPRLRVPAD
jgi:hypothetical protein